MLIFTFLLVSLFLSGNLTCVDSWQTLAPGIELKILDAKSISAESDSKITIVRIDPRLWELVFAGISQQGEESIKTAREWCESHKLTAAINAGMFATDYRTHTGYLKHNDHLNSKYINSYQSVLAFNPVKGKDLPPVQIFDLDVPGITMQSIQNQYNSVIQNLRLIKKPGINVWKLQNRKWSEAAIGEDEKGRILFIFSRSPFSMHDLNEVLLNSGISIVAAQHLEGGPEAQLYIKVGEFELELGGSYETSYNENNSNITIWPIPNIIGIQSKIMQVK
jgi:hypothetical protein